MLSLFLVSLHLKLIKTMTGLEIFQRTARYEQESSNIRLHAPEWRFLLAFDGQKTVEDAGKAADLPLDEALALTSRFRDKEWIEEQPITLEQYLRRAGSPAPKVAAPAPEAPPVPPPLPVIAPAPATPDQTGRGPMRLGAVVDYITSLVGNTAVGQMLVYRVFLRVPSELLQQEDIGSVQLSGEAGLIQSEKLQEALARAVFEVTRRPLPDGIYAPA